MNNIFGAFLSHCGQLLRQNLSMLRLVNLTFQYGQQRHRGRPFLKQKLLFPPSHRSQQYVPYPSFKSRTSMNILEVRPPQRFMASTLDIGNLMWAIGFTPPVLYCAGKNSLSNSNTWSWTCRKKLSIYSPKNTRFSMQVEHFREVLDEEARRLGLKASRAKLNETDMLYPLSLTHFCSSQ